MKTNYMSNPQTYSIECMVQIVIVTGQQGHNSRPEKDIISGQMLS